MNCGIIDENRGECMIVEITSKDELQLVAGKFKNASSQLSSETLCIIGNLLESEDFDGINISQAATAIQNNLKNISGEAESLSSSLNNYITDIKNLDTYDLRIDEGRNNNVFGNEATSGMKEPLFLFENDDSSF